MRVKFGISVSMIIILLFCFCINYSKADSAIRILNHDFDKFDESTGKLDGWNFEAYKQENAFFSVEKDNQSKNCLYINSNQANDVRVVQKIVVEPEAYYKFKCLIKTKNIEGGNGANISVLDSVASSDGVYGNSEWTQAELIGKTGINQNSVYLALRIGGYGTESKGEAWFKNVSAELLNDVPKSYSLLYDDSYDVEQPVVVGNEMPYKSVVILVSAFCIIAVIIVYFVVLGKKESEFIPIDDSKKQGKIGIAAIIILGLIIRIICNYCFKSLGGTFGHTTDIICFEAWGDKVFREGPANFYEKGYFADYPPAYMYVLAIAAGFRWLFGFGYSSASFALLIKLPAIICDLLSGYMVYKISLNNGRTYRTSVLFAALIVLNPIFVFISAVWAQIDIVLTILLALSFLLLSTGFKKNKKSSIILSGLVYGAAVAIKPQALMAGPIFALAYVIYIIKNKNHLEAFINTIISAVIAVLIIILPALPFTGKQEGFWLLDKYLGTATSYNYASVEAFNFMALIGGNWVEIDKTVLGTGITYKALGVTMMAVVIISSVLIYIFTDNKKQGVIFLTASFMLSGLFTFGHYMHERYLFPVLLLVLIAMIYYNDKRLFIAYGGFTVTLIINSICAYIIRDVPDVRFGDYQTLLIIGSSLMVALFLYFTYVCIDLLIIKHGETKTPCFVKELNK